MRYSRLRWHRKTVCLVQAPAGSCSGQASATQLAADITQLTSPSGYLSSIISDVTGCGRSQSPWTIVVRPGQTIRATLYDFGLRRSHRHLAASPQTTTWLPLPPSSPAASEPTCHLYAVLVEPASTTNQSNVSVCGGQQRLSPIVTTSTNQLTVVFTHQDIAHRTPHFLIHYEGLTPPSLVLVIISKRAFFSFFTLNWFI